MSKETLLTTSEAAEKLGVTRWRVNAMIRDKRIKAEKFGQIFLIKEKDLESVKNRKPGRPPGKLKSAAGNGKGGARNNSRVGKR